MSEMFGRMNLILQGPFLDLEVLNRMRSGFGQVH
jgi:hypothetical protein